MVVVHEQDAPTRVWLAEPGPDSALAAAVGAAVRPYDWARADSLRAIRRTRAGSTQRATDATEDDIPPRAFRVSATAAAGGWALRLTSPRMCRPEVLNRGELAKLVGRAHAQLNRDGTAVLMLWIDETGAVRKVEVSRSSGDPLVDAMAASVGEAARFSPAMVEDHGVRVRLNWPVVFRKP